ncbi:MAG: DUF2950 family protein, partial [Desulfuromonadaceae bacterium]
MNISLFNAIIRMFWQVVLAGVAVVVLSVSASVPDCVAMEVRQKLFPSPDQAAQALVTAAKTDDLATMQAILGPGSKELIFSGDSVADNAGRDKFVASYEQKHS